MTAALLKELNQIDVDEYIAKSFQQALCRRNYCSPTRCLHSQTSVARLEALLWPPHCLASPCWLVGISVGASCAASSPKPATLTTIFGFSTGQRHAWEG